VQLHAVARGQNWLITFDQLRAIGFSRTAIDHMVKTGRLFRVHRGVYLVGRAELSLESRIHAAALAIGDDAAVGGFAAAALFGCWKGKVGAVEVFVPRMVRSRPGIKVHRCSGMPPVTKRYGIPLTTPEATILYLAGEMYSDRHFRRLVHEGQVQKVASLSALLAEVARAPKRTQAVERVERELADGAKPTRSFAEDDLVELLRRGPFPHFETNAHVPGTPSWVEVDVWFPGRRLVVEIDGPHHDTAYQKEFDAYKDGVVRAANADVLRLETDAVTPARETDTSARISDRLQACK
jgi:very-short-patch-repair endonuclease